MCIVFYSFFKTNIDNQFDFALAAVIADFSANYCIVCTVAAGFGTGLKMFQQS